MAWCGSSSIGLEAPLRVVHDDRVVVRSSDVCALECFDDEHDALESLTLLDEDVDASSGPAAGRWLTAIAKRSVQCCEWILGIFIAAPARLRFFVISAFIVTMTLGYSVRPAHANGQVLDGIQNLFDAQAGGWMRLSLNLGVKLFLALALIVIVYNIVSFYLHYQSVSGMALVLVRTMLALGIPYAIITVIAPLLLTNLIGVAGQFSSAITGIRPAATTPDSIVVIGLQIGWGLLENSWKIFAASHFTFDIANVGNSLGYDVFQGAVDILFMILAIVLCVVMIAAFTFIAVELLLATLQAIFSLPLGVWALGFMAAPATAGIASGVWSGILQVIVRYIAILAGATFAQQVGLQWTADVAAQIAAMGKGLTSTTTGAPVVDIGAFRLIVSYTLGGLALLYIVRQLPALAMSALSGAPVFSGAGLTDRVVSGAMNAPGTAFSLAAGPSQAFRVAGGFVGQFAQSAAAGNSLGSALKTGTDGAIAGAQRARQIRNLLK